RTTQFQRVSPSWNPYGTHGPSWAKIKIAWVPAISNLRHTGSRGSNAEGEALRPDGRRLEGQGPGRLLGRPRARARPARLAGAQGVVCRLPDRGKEGPAHLRQLPVDFRLRR